MIGEAYAPVMPSVNLELFKIARELKAPYLPPDAFGLAVYAELCGVEVKTIRRWVLKYRIPHLKPGDEMIVRASQFLPHIPYVIEPAENE